MSKLLILLCFLFLSCGKIVNSPFGTETFSNVFNKNEQSINQLVDDGSPASFALFADSHENFTDLEEAVKQVPLQKTDFLIHLGDFTDIATNLEYDLYLDSMSKLNVPWFTTIGNHDAIGKGKELFKKHLGEFNFFFDYKGVRFIIFNNNAKEFDKEGLDYNWLNSTINSSNNPVLIFQHIDSFNKSAFNESQMELNKQYIEHKKVVGVFNGHRHSFLLSKYADKNLIQIDRTERVMYSRVTIHKDTITVFRCMRGNCEEAISYSIFNN